MTAKKAVFPCHLSSSLLQDAHPSFIMNTSLEIEEFPQHSELNANSIKYIRAYYLYAQRLLT